VAAGGFYKVLVNSLLPEFMNLELASCVQHL